MDFFEKFVIPSGANHLALHNYILIIAMLLFIPYLCLTFGGISLSLLYYKIGKKHDNKKMLRFSADIADKLIINKGILPLGIIPAISILLSYVQLLAGAKTIALPVMTLAVLMLIAALIFIYRYRSASRLTTFFKTPLFKNKQEEHAVPADKISETEQELLSQRVTSGRVGSVLFYLGIYIFAGALALINMPERWLGVNNILQVIFSLPTLLNFAYFAVASAFISGAGILFYFFVWDTVADRIPEYSAFVRNVALTLSIVSGILFPLMMLLNIVYLPFWTFSQSVYFYFFIALVLALITTSFLYYAIKNSDVRFSAIIFALIILVFLFSILKDQSLFASANREQTALILQKGDEYEKLKKSRVISVSDVNGEEVFKQKCASCHKFDAKVVGPAYNDVVPKYAGDVKKLSSYIMNPTKIDPAFPPMPNPGIKTKEAQAVADYLIKNAGKK